LQNERVTPPAEEARQRQLPDTTAAGIRKPKLDFYTVLPEIERVMPESDFIAEPEQQPLRTASVYMLQAASYRSHAEADKLKAKLALANFEASIQQVTVQGRGVFYRVRLGPFADKRKLKTARQSLAKLGIDALPLSLSPQ
jgi:cell division protein FtsN